MDVTQNWVLISDTHPQILIANFVLNQILEMKVQWYMLVKMLDWIAVDELPVLFNVAITQ